MGGPLSQIPEGLIGGFQGSLTEKFLMVVFSSIALYNAIELIILIFLVFNHYAGLYFWTMLLSNVLGVIPHAVGYLLEFFAKGPLWLAVTLSTIGFYFMVPGQSIVLYSRLHLVVQNRKVLCRVRYMILFNTIVLLIPTTVLTYCTIYVRTEPIIRGYNVIERMQLAWFCAQEILISLIYIWETINLLRLRPEKDPGRTKIMYELIAINVVIVLLDVALLVLEYVGFYALQTTLKAAVYSVKLKLEFAVLRKLVSLVHARPSDSSSTDHDKYPNFVNPRHLAGDITHATPVPAQTRSRYWWSAISVDSLDRSEPRGFSSEATRPL
ncbi:hypothetical protein BDV28DRAFT_133200 [Aspergillus coremiiformis]|uniref:DUF7703 domain-containing protein n=1 Tax=Aspergillus coremiiformis TaxID=138285 RepID=A0A5N6Z9A5_9EURO|nr:hypothetical protein BDV28DRAFT_133200 [Aspergillus coremiiformis]